MTYTVTPRFFMRSFTDSDYPMLREWWEARGRSTVPIAPMLPKLGVIASDDSGDCAAAFLYMDNSVGVCWIEYPVTRPGMPLSETRQVMGEITAFLKQSAAAMGYGLMVAYTLPAIARELRRLGFAEMRRDMVMMVAPTSTEEHNGN